MSAGEPRASQRAPALAGRGPAIAGGEGAGGDPDATVQAIRVGHDELGTSLFAEDPSADRLELALALDLEPAGHPQARASPAPTPSRAGTLDDSTSGELGAALREAELCVSEPEIARARDRVKVALLGRPSAAPRGAAEPAPDAHPKTLGRFSLLRELGRGAMGLVWLAHDPELDRQVAIKVLRPGRRRDARALERLRREAQGIAKLSDPHVVGVYEVGTHDGQLFVVMEYVAGATLRSWGPGRSRDEIIGAYLQAARGLAAAHQRGLVHRDFKPDNVLVGDDGRVRVADFGLVALAEDPTSTMLTTTDSRTHSASGDKDPPRTHASREPTTRAIGVVGTPRYMAPELFAGAPASPASDQFAFAVALFEQLAGSPPFKGATLSELVTELFERPRPRRPPSIPLALYRVICRALALRPDDRFPDMRTLARALERASAISKGRTWVLAAAAAALAGGLGLGLRHWDHQARVAACALEGRAIAADWNDAHARVIETRLGATGLPHAETTTARIREQLTGWAETWAAAREQACRHHAVTGRWDQLVADRARACLDDRRLALRALVEQLARADRDVGNRAIQAVMELPRLGPCTDERWLTSASQLGALTETLAYRQALAQVSALVASGRFDEAATLGAGLSPGDAPSLRATHHLALGRALEGQGRFDEAERELELAYFAAARDEATELMVAAASALGHLVGIRRSRATEGDRWLALAEVALDRLGPQADTELERAAIATIRGAIAIRRGDWAAAEAQIESARSVRERRLGPQHPRVATALNALGNLAFERAQYDRARSLHERALAIRERSLGPAHPDVATSLNNLANARVMSGDPRGARDALERAIEIREATLAPDHPLLVGSIDNLGNVYDQLGDPGHALALHERALAMRERTLEPTHVELAASLHNVGAMALHLDRRERAAALLQRAWEIRAQAHGPEHPATATTRCMLADALSEPGQRPLAREHARACLRASELEPEPDDESVAAAARRLAELEFELGEPAVALELAERALALRTAPGASPPPGHLADTRFIVARALWDTSGTERASPAQAAARARAVALAAGARAHYAAVDPQAPELAEIDAWLADHPLP